MRFNWKPKYAGVLDGTREIESEVAAEERNHSLDDPTPLLRRSSLTIIRKTVAAGSNAIS